jgi:uncharacterized protein (TIGR02444 family)
MTTNSPNLMAELDNPFWRFSITVYHNKPVKEACLSFQEEEKANVNALLLCCWLAYAVKKIPKTKLLKSCHSIDNWNQNVTQSLRSTRRWVKALKKNDWVEEFSQQLVMDEIVSETYQQHKLYSCFRHSLKKTPNKNEEQAYVYLSWVFSDLGLTIDKALDDKIRHFVAVVFSMVLDEE